MILVAAARRHDDEIAATAHHESAVRLQHDGPGRARLVRQGGARNTGACERGVERAVEPIARDREARGALEAAGRHELPVRLLQQVGGPTGNEGRHLPSAAERRIERPIERVADEGELAEGGACRRLQFVDAPRGHD